MLKKALKNLQMDFLKKRLKLPLFWQFILTYFLIVGVVIATLMPLYYKALSISMESYIKKSSYALNHSTIALENTVGAICEIPQTIKQSQYYTDIKLLRSSKFALPYYYYLGTVREFFAQQCAMVDLANTGFLIFSNSGICITKDSFFQSTQDCFTRHIKYNEYSADEMMTRFILNSNKQLELLPAMNVSIDSKQSEKYLTLINHPTGNSCIVGMLISEKDIMELFSISSLPQNAFFYIVNPVGEILMTHQYDGAPLIFAEDMEKHDYMGEGFSVIRCSINSLNCTAVIGIPDSYFTEMLKPLDVMNKRYIIAAILIGAVLSTIFTILQLLPVRKLLHVSLMRRYTGKERMANEFHYIRKVMDSASDEIKQLHNDIAERENTLRVNMFIRLLYGTVYLGDELTLVYQLIPDLKSDCRIVLIQMELLECGQPDEDFVCYKVYEQMLSLLPSEILPAHPDLTKIAVLIPDTEQFINLISDVVRQIGSSAEKKGILISAGVSDAFTGVNGVHKAFFHAQLCLNTSVSNQIHFYSSTPDSTTEKIVDITGLQKLYELIMAYEADSIRDMFNTIVDIVISGVYSSDDVKQVYYSIRFILESVIKDAKCDSEKFVLPGYRENNSVQSLFDELCSIALEISEELEKRKSIASCEFAERIIAYIQENIADPSMCVESIIKEFNISRSFLYKLMKDTTARSISEYIEMIRMEKARELLDTTEMNVSDIAAVCGYNTPNTFYKVFKRCYGVTPSAYRNNCKKHIINPISNR